MLYGQILDSRLRECAGNVEKIEQDSTKTVSIECHECVMYKRNGVEISETSALGEQT